MTLKDHYKTLQLPPQATAAEIKKAYRSLALQYHPDKTQNDPYAAAQFAAIKEAYETLSHPWKKQRYLEERWYQQSLGRAGEARPLTPVTLLQDALQLERRTAGADVFRMDQAALFREMDALLSSEAMDCLRRFREGQINGQLTDVLCRPLLLLSPAQANRLAGRLYELAADDQRRHEQISNCLAAVNSEHRRQKWQWLWILVALAALYALIRFSQA